MNLVKVPQLAWYEPKELELPLPDSWQVEIANMAGYNRPALKPEEIRKAIKSPIATPPIRELARGKKEVAILFDDMTRVTRAAEIVPFVLEELAEAGISDSQIRFVGAIGLHGTMNRMELAKKLGEDIVARFPVYNHNAFDDCTYVGTTSTFQTKVYVNQEVMSCDLKIAIGSVVPHPMGGYGGGGKLVLPGVCSFETIKDNHLRYVEDKKKRQDKTVYKMGLTIENPLRADIDEAARLAGLDIIINCLLNTWGETVEVFAGAMEPAFKAAVEAAKTHYLTPTLKDKDIVIANTYAKANEAAIGLIIGFPAVKKEGGDLVLIANAPDGLIPHYLRRWGKTDPGILANQPVPTNVNRLIVYTEYPEANSKNWIEESDRVMVLYKWDDVLKVLQENHGEGVKVAVYPNAEIQYSL